MRIYFYLKHFPRGKTKFYEGTSKAVHGLAAGLVQQGSTVTVLCEGNDAGTFDAPSGYRVECFPAPHSSPSFQLSPQLLTYVRQQITAQDLVVLNGSFHRSLYSLARHLKQAAIPFVVAPHEVYHPAMFAKNTYLKLPYWLLCERPMLRSANAVQLLDSRHAAYLVERGLSTTHLEVPNGLHPNEVAAGIEGGISPFHQDAPRFIFYGRLDMHHKGLDLLVRSFAAAAPPECELTLQGPDSGDKSVLQDLQHQLSAQIRFQPPNYDIPSEQLLSQYDVVCLTSRFEGFGLVALEAMIAGRILLVSEEAGIAPHIVTSGCGVTVPPTLDGIQSGIQTLLHRRGEWHSMGQRGRDYALQNLTWSKIAQRAIAEYSRLPSPPTAYSSPRLRSS